MKCFTNKVKIVSKNLDQLLTPIGLAYWIKDYDSKFT